METQKDKIGMRKILDVGWFQTFFQHIYLARKSEFDVGIDSRLLIWNFFVVIRLKFI